MYLNKRQGGIALIAVLFLLAVLTILAFTLSRDVRTDITLTSRHLKHAQALALAEEGIWRGSAMVLSRNQSDDNSGLLTGGVRVLNAEIGELSVATQACSGLIDLNNASPELFKSALMSIDEASSTADVIVGSILDWRDEDDEVRPNGAEADYYEINNMLVLPKNGQINSVEELAWINGVSPVIFEKLRPLVTVYSGQPRIDIYTAPESVLHAIPFLNDSMISRIIEQRKQGDKRLPIEDIANEARAYIGSSEHDCIHISSYANVQGSVAGIVAVIKIEATPESPVKVIAWRQQIDSVFN